jgi:GT2 family glycosyltransferase/thioredoxin-like negative regulator of GroEL
MSRDDLMGPGPSSSTELGPGRDTPPAGALASILILCCNQLDYTRLCLESVLRWTATPYELVLVDNGSSDGTNAYLDEIGRRGGPDRVVLIRNEINRGFAAGCNQAIAMARSRSLVFLNNDTIVTDGWLEGLIACAAREGPSVGLVGATSNYANPPQLVAPDYEDLRGLEDSALRRRREFAGRALGAERLTGFCLLVRRAVLERVGNLDERFGLGFFDDDDLCVRAREAGFALRVALDVYVHHFGSRTFAGLGIDCERQLKENFARFRAKWGPARAAGYYLPWEKPAEAGAAVAAAVTAPVSARARPRVSLCMIVKNEEDNLPACLATVADLVDEVVVVDTGSTDRTRAVAAGSGARVFDFPWVDDFAAARNESLRHAGGEWIFWLDADDRLDAENRARLRGLLAGLNDENMAYVMKCVCRSEQADGSVTVVDHVRLFRNHPDLQWKYRVHEQILPALRRLKTEVRWADVTIEHLGYEDPALRGRKLQRDLRLLRLEVAERPDDPFTLFNLGSVYQELGRHAEALPLLKGSLERSHPSDSIVRKLYALVVQCHRRLDQAREALAACQAGRAIYPDDMELLFQEGLVLRTLGDAAGAESRFQRLLGAREGEHFASVDPGLRGYKTRHNLAVLYHEEGRVGEAEAQWRAAVQECPGFTPGWLGLGEICLARGSWDALATIVAHLEAGAATALDARLLRARGLLKQKEFAPARRLLEEAIAAAPEALRPRVLLSHVLLQEDRDHAAAERALRDILALDPLNAEARHNLAVLLAADRK